MSVRLTRLGNGLVSTFIERQISYDSNNVPLDLQGVFTKLINPLEELQTPVGNYVFTVALYLQAGCVSVSSGHFVMISMYYVIITNVLALKTTSCHLILLHLKEEIYLYGQYI